MVGVSVLKGGSQIMLLAVPAVPALDDADFAL